MCACVEGGEGREGGGRDREREKDLERSRGKQTLEDVLEASFFHQIYYQYSKTLF